jgi:hypothetical protein
MSLWKRGRQYWTDFTVNGRRYRKRLGVPGFLSHSNATARSNRPSGTVLFALMSASVQRCQRGCCSFVETDRPA